MLYWIILNALTIFMRVTMEGNKKRALVMQTNLQVNAWNEDVQINKEKAYVPFK